MRQISKDQAKRLKIYNKIRTCEEHHLFGRNGKLLFMCYNRYPVKDRYTHECLHRIHGRDKYLISLKFACRYFINKYGFNWITWVNNQYGKNAIDIKEILHTLYQYT